jgi:hypothetical protein
VTDMTISPANWVASVFIAAASVYQFFSGQPVLNGLHPPDQAGTIPNSELPSDLSELTGAFTGLRPFGFTQVSVQVNTAPAAAAFYNGLPGGVAPSAAVEIDLVHPCDGAPTITNAIAAPGTTFNVATLMPPATTVAAGSSLTVSGQGFPPGQTSQLEVDWSDTCSGTLFQSELQWGLASAPGMPPLAANLNDVVVPNSGPEQVTTYATPANQSLEPGTWYAFRVRDFDCEGDVASQWSSWRYLQTQVSDQIELVFSYENRQLATVDLPLAGDFAVTVTIPADVPPSDTPYTLSAMSGSVQLAQAQVTVLAPGAKPPPILQLYTEATGAPAQGLVTLYSPSTVTLHGENFLAGPVALWLDSTGGTGGGGGTNLGAATASATGSFTVTVPWPAPPYGFHKILAVQAALQADVTVWETGVVQ